MKFIIPKKAIFLILVLNLDKIQSGLSQNDPLFLTPYILSGSIDQAKLLSQVRNLSDSFNNSTRLIEGRESYSGFITVNETFDSNLFFWFFPANNNATNAPLILWIEGGPGLSSLMTLFYQNGPYFVADDCLIENRPAEIDWTSDYSVIYLDSPIGAGFSFTNDTRGYVNSSEEAAEHTIEFLRQFFMLFPEYQNNSFWISGESYGGHMSAPLMSRIHENNQNNVEPTINLKGLLLFGPVLHQLGQATTYGKYLYQVGLIDNSTLQIFNSQELIIQNLILAEEYAEASNVWLRLMAHPDSVFTNASGFSSYLNLLEPDRSPSFSNFTCYFQKSIFRQAVHVGNLTYTLANQFVYETLTRNDFMESKLHYIEGLLNATTISEEEKYQIIIVAGQLDLVITHVGLETMLEDSNWIGAEEFKLTDRSLWKYRNETVAGYIKKVRNLTYFLLRNAGHNMIHDQPSWIIEFMDGLSWD